MHGQAIYKDFTKMLDGDGATCFTCNVCKKPFKKRVLFAQHYNYVHLKNRPKLRRCRICGDKFVDSTRATHMEDKHGLPAPSCGACGKKFAFPWQVLRHQKFYHMGESDFQCELCDEIFISNSALKTHMRKHRDVSAKCELCGKAFKSTQGLKRHLFQHTNERPHVCGVCAESFACGNSLKRHMVKRHASVGI